MTSLQVFDWTHFRFWLWSFFRCELKFWKASVGASVTFFMGDGDRDLQFHFGCWLFAIYLTFEDVLPRKWVPKGHDCSRETGVTYFERSIMFDVWAGDDWNSTDPWYRHFSIHMPHDYDWIRTSQLLADGVSWETETKGNHKDFYNKKLWSGKLWEETHPYKYKLKSGEIQNVAATIRVSEREWRMKFLKWTRLFAKTSRTIGVDFSDEVGEETGSWKGGCTGCGYKILPGETPLDTLRRMEKERKF